jgi:CheY-like chemotaxis protein
MHDVRKTWPRAPAVHMPRTPANAAFVPGAGRAASAGVAELRCADAAALAALRPSGPVFTSSMHPLFQMPQAEPTSTLDSRIQAVIADSRRLSAVHAARMLDTPAEASFDRLTRLATRIVGAPVSFLSLVDDQRDFYKSQCGFGEPLATLRELRGRTFCHFGLLSGQPLVIDDVMTNPEYARVPTVQTLGIRAYLGVPLITEEGECIGSFCAVDFAARHWTERDVSVMSELALAAMREIALRQARRKADAANLAKSAFLANMSHEIRTPMNAILGFAHVLARTPMAPTQREHLAHISTAGEHLMGLLNNVLDLSHIEAGQLTLAQTDFELRPLMEEVSNLVGAAARAKGLGLQVQTLDAPARLRGDPMRLRQMVLNLAGNAVKFTSAGSVALGVQTVRQEAGRCLLRFHVTDTGIGLRSEQLAGLFQPFKQADVSTTREFGGAGLGLAINRQLAKLMGGECGADSQLGLGSDFWFTAWFDAATNGPEVAAAAPRNFAAELRNAYAGARVLVVEDNPINQEVALALLGDAGLDVQIAHDGLQAVEMAGQGFELLLMDVQMPRMDGLQATRQIRTNPQLARLPIVAMSASAFDEDQGECRAAGMNDFITKPLEPEQLFATVLKWLSQPRTLHS